MSECEEAPRAASPDPTKTAYPVVYLLMRRVERNGSNRKMLRTEIRAGIVNNRTRADVTEQDKYELAGIIGPFDNMSQASSFKNMWRNVGSANRLPTTDAGACRGPARVARGMQLAELWQVHPWFDFAVVYGCPTKHYALIADGKELYATGTSVH